MELGRYFYQQEVELVAFPSQSARTSGADVLARLSEGVAMSILAASVWLCKAGYALTWLQPRSKVPIPTLIYDVSGELDRAPLDLLPSVLTIEQAIS